MTLASLERALPVAHSKQLLEALNLRAMGSVHYALDELEAALVSLQQAISISRNIGEFELEAGALFMVGLIYSELAEFELATGYLQKALSLSREVGDRELEIQALHLIASTYTKLGNELAAKRYSRQLDDSLN